MQSQGKCIRVACSKAWFEQSSTPLGCNCLQYYGHVSGLAAYPLFFVHKETCEVLADETATGESAAVAAWPPLAKSPPRKSNQAAFRPKARPPLLNIRKAACNQAATRTTALLSVPDTKQEGARPLPAMLRLLMEGELHWECNEVPVRMDARLSLSDSGG